MTDKEPSRHAFMSETIGKLTEALSKAQGQFEHAAKETKNEFFRSKYASLASVIDAAKKPLAENGLAVIQSTDFTEDGKSFLLTVLSHSSGEWIMGKYPLNPVKPDPQGMGSCVSYARRYAFSAITGIAADDDDGNEASRSTTPNKPQQRAAPGTMSRTVKPDTKEQNPEFIDDDGVITTLTSPSPQSLVFASEEQLMTLSDYIDELKIPMETQKKWLEKAGVVSIRDMDADKIQKLIDSMKEKYDAR